MGGAGPQGTCTLTTIILICLGIILAAGSVMMTVYYGGDAMKAGSVKAQAATLENAAQNVRVALTGRRFVGDRSTPSSLSDIGGGGGWMDGMPDVSQAGGGEPVLKDVDGRRIYAVPRIPADVCSQINRDYRGFPEIPSAMGGRSKGCMSEADGSHTFYVVLGTAA